MNLELGGGLGGGEVVKFRCSLDFQVGVEMYQQRANKRSKNMCLVFASPHALTI